MFLKRKKPKKTKQILDFLELSGSLHHLRKRNNNNSPSLSRGVLLDPCVILHVSMTQILTKDAVTTQVDGVVYYRIHSAVSAVANVTDVHSATFLLAQTTLRNVLGTKSLAQLLAGREEIAHGIQVNLAHEFIGKQGDLFWGVAN